MSTQNRALIQTGAILLDAYRDLNSRKMFWIVMILSALAVGVFALFGTSGRSLTFLWYTLPPFENADQALVWYKYGFSTLLIGVYLTWLAAGLALVSTASIFPDLMTGGSIDLYLSKPIGRLRLFFTKYISGLLFVTLQVAVFAVGSFLVLGLRGHSWEPSLFLAIPIVVLFFSYLYGICVLFGVMTRSTIAALLLTLLAWFCIFAMDWVDKQVSKVAVMMPLVHEQAVRRTATLDRQIAEMEKAGASTEGASTESASTQGASTESATVKGGVVVINGRAVSVDVTAHPLNLQELREQRDMYARQAAEPPVPPVMEKVQTTILVIKTFVPKTRETTNLLDRYLLPEWQLEKSSTHADDDLNNRDNPQMFMNMDDPTRGRSAWWVIGSSLGFEAVCVGLAAWIFKRRDY